MEGERKAEGLPAWEVGIGGKRKAQAMEGDRAGDEVGKKNKTGD